MKHEPLIRFVAVDDMVALLAESEICRRRFFAE